MKNLTKQFNYPLTSSRLLIPGIIVTGYLLIRSFAPSVLNNFLDLFKVKRHSKAKKPDPKTIYKQDAIIKGKAALSHIPESTPNSSPSSMQTEIEALTSYKDLFEEIIGELIEQESNKKDIVNMEDWEIRILLLVTCQERLKSVKTHNINIFMDIFQKFILNYNFSDIKNDLMQRARFIKRPLAKGTTITTPSAPPVDDTSELTLTSTIYRGMYSSFSQFEQGQRSSDKQFNLVETVINIDLTALEETETATVSKAQQTSNTRFK